ncbi:MAG: SRPBCC family protein [Nocardioidaceae bacterium]
MSQTSIRRHQESVTVEASAETLYDLVSDITRTGEWSPVCTSCWWDDEVEAGQVGAWFTGRNELPQRTWETRSEVVAAERRSRVRLGGAVSSFVRWGFTLAPVDTGTSLTRRGPGSSCRAGSPCSRRSSVTGRSVQITDSHAAGARRHPEERSPAIKRIAESTGCR